MERLHPGSSRRRDPLNEIVERAPALPTPGQFHDESRALPDLALHPDMPVVMFDDLLADR
jgi:hypothetical protein